MTNEDQRHLIAKFAQSLNEGHFEHSTFYRSPKRGKLDIYQGDVKSGKETYVFKVHAVNKEIPVSNVARAITSKFADITRCQLSEKRFDATVWHDGICYTLWHQKKAT